MQATRGQRDAAWARWEISLHLVPKIRDNFRSAFRDATGGRDALDVAPDIGQCVWLQRHQFRPAGHPACQRALYIFQADGAYAALRLSDNMSWLQRVQPLSRDFVDGERIGDPLLNSLVDFSARSIGREGG